MARLLLWCEARADFQMIADLVERVLREEGPSWLGDLLENLASMTGLILDWIPDGEGRAFFDLHQLREYARQLGVRVPQGHFDGQPGAPGALMARTAFLVARELVRRGTEVDAVLLVWDMDDQGKARRHGLEQARTEARHLVSLSVVLGCPEPMREAWVLAGFDSETDAERERLEAMRRELGFSPCQEAHRLDAKKEQARRSPKRVLDVLTAGERDRQVRCWTTAPLVSLRARGKDSGLTAFLDEVSSVLIPLFTGAPTPPAAQD